MAPSAAQTANTNPYLQSMYAAAAAASANPYAIPTAAGLIPYATSRYLSDNLALGTIRPLTIHPQKKKIMLFDLTNLT
jgi:hypothetical protein